MKNLSTNKLQPSFSTQTCPLNLIMPQAMHYSRHAISDTEILQQTQQKISQWEKKITRSQISSLGTSICLFYPTWAPWMPGELQLFLESPWVPSLHVPWSPALEGVQDNINPEEGWRTYSGAETFLVGSLEAPSRSWEEHKGSRGVWEGSVPPRVISHKLCQLSAVRQILEMSTFPILVGRGSTHYLWFCCPGSCNSQ